MAWKNFVPNYSFPPKFFGDELAVITAEAYERDSSYWEKARIAPLEAKEREMVNLRDSIERAHNDPAYRDSIQRAYNKITPLEVLVTGMGFRKEEQKRHFYVGSLVDLVKFEIIGGFRIGPPSFSYYKQWKNGKVLSTFTSASLGLRNKDLQGNGSVFFRYDPFRLGDVRIAGGRSFASVNPFDAYLNQLRASNYILNDYISGMHRIELFNGFYVSTTLSFRNRYSIEGMDTRSFLSDLVGEPNPIPFSNYQALIGEWKVSYTPKQRYVREPNKKVVLGSKFPTIGLMHRKGINGLLSSDIDFDYLEASLEHNLVLGTLGNTKYTVQVGKFFNTKNLRFVDAKRFRQSDPILYSDPLHSFQLLDTALTTAGYFFEAHHIHHFNGAFLNSIPLIKKTKIGLVAGAGMMWVNDSNFHYEEIFGGLERSFKLGARRRLRLGIYGIVSQSSRQGLNQGFKISFDVIDTWKKEWSF
jgi:hypothetical protein